MDKRNYTHTNARTHAQPHTHIYIYTLYKKKPKYIYQSLWNRYKIHLLCELHAVADNNCWSSVADKISQMKYVGIKINGIKLRKKLRKDFWILEDISEIYRQHSHLTGPQRETSLDLTTGLPRYMHVCVYVYIFINHIVYVYMIFI